MMTKRRIPAIAFLTVLLSLVAQRRCEAQASGFLWSSPGTLPFIGSAQAYDWGGSPFSPLLSTSYVARAGVVFDTTRLNDFSSGSFVPGAIPVKGEPFFNSGEHASVQGSGSAVQVAVNGSTPNADYSVYAIGVGDTGFSGAGTTASASLAQVSTLR